MTVAIYRIFDADDVLLYVGQTANTEVRFRDHRRQRWCPPDARFVVTEYATRGEALAAEREAIATERPLRNKIWRPDYVAPYRAKPVNETSAVIGARLKRSRGTRLAGPIAASLGITPQTWYRYESGVISVPPARYGQVAEALGAPWTELFAPTDTTAAVA